MKSTPVPTTEKPLKSDVTESFLLHVTSTLTAPMQNFVTGRIVRGSLHINDEVDIATAISLKNSHCRCILKLVTFNYQVVDECRAPDNISLALSGLSRDDIESQMIIASPGTFSFYNGCQVSLTNNSNHPIPTGEGLECTFYWDTLSRMTLPAGITQIMPGETLNNVTLLFARPSVIELDQTFYSSTPNACTGVVTGYGTISKSGHAVE